ncbi:MAG: bacillithiol transferase BstA [Acidobacteria bacterium]|nr:bacillithiol transferase BstA [Acidobacteriota bacterium]
MDDLRYPIGEFDCDFEVSRAARAARIADIRALPQKMREAVAGLSDEQLDTEYRPEGWTVRQTVHHVADSHANSIIRFKLALTEDETPTIKPYYEDRWAELGDSKLPIDVSLALIDGIHTRWLALMDSMTDADFNKKFIHPETGEWTLDGALALYAWHSKHHTAHITHLIKRKGW